MDALELRRVEAKVFAYNVISINALRRNGFQQEGVLREAKTYGGQRWDILVFSILESEMREQRRRDDFGSFEPWTTDART
jgi:RimJ/RimL family protein N-acetyltransferase